MISRYFDINENGHSIRCKLYEPGSKEIRRLILFGPGFGGHKDNRAAQTFAERMISKYKNVALVTFNWPCHGDDARKKLLLSECLDYLGTVLSYLRETYSPEFIDGYATSFGAYLFLLYSARFGFPFRRLALRCPALPMHEVITRSIMTDDDIRALEKGKEVLVGFDRKVKISPQFLQDLKDNDVTTMDFMDVADNIFICHGTKDEIVPIDRARQFAEDNVIEFAEIDGADHRFQNPKKMDQAIQLMQEFFDYGG